MHFKMHFKMNFKNGEIKCISNYTGSVIDQIKVFIFNFKK
jgi:hypothetical protein